MSYSHPVTGGAGYSRFDHGSRSLRARPSVTVLDNFLYRQASLNHVCHHPNFSVVRADIRVEGAVAPLLKKADVSSAAALVGAADVHAGPGRRHDREPRRHAMMLRHLSKNQIGG